MHSKTYSILFKFSGLILLLAVTAIYSQNGSAQTFSVSCSGLDVNPSIENCQLNTDTGPVPFTESQVVNLVGDLGDLSACSNIIGAADGTICNTGTFQCTSTTNTGGANIISCQSGNVPKSVFEIQCSSISNATAECAIINDLSGAFVAIGANGEITPLLTPNQIGFATTMLSVCDNQYGISAALRSDCFLLETLLTNNDPQAAKLIEALTPDAASAAVDATQTSLRGLNRNIAQRMSSLRRAMRAGTAKDDKDSNDDNKSNDEQESFNGLRFRHQDTDLARWAIEYQVLTGGAASADSGSGKLGVFVNGMIDNGDKDNTDKERGFKFAGGEVTTGVDYRLGASGFLGMAFGFTHSNTDVKDDRGRLANRSYNMIVYGSVNPNPHSYIDINAILGAGQFEQERHIIFNDPNNPLNNIDNIAEARYFSKQTSLNLSLGYDLANGPLSFSPYAMLTIMSAKADAYTENMTDVSGNGAGAALTIDPQTFESKSMTFGGQVSYASSQSWGVLLPQATLEWINETQGDAQVVSGHFVGDPNKTAFRLNTDDPDTVYYNFGLGLSALFPGGNTVYGYYQTFFGYEGFRYYSVNLGARWEL